MVADLDAARRLCRVGEEEARLLTAPRRPVVLLERRPDAAAAPSVVGRYSPNLRQRATS